MRADRADAFTPDTAGGTAGVDGPLALALADELVAISSRLSDLAYSLGSDPETLRKHMTSLQAVDHVTQGQLAIAAILRSTEPVADRLDAVTLEEMAARLRANRDFRRNNMR